MHFFRLFHPRLEYISYICSEKRQYYPLMLDRTQTIEKLKATRQYRDEHYGVHSMTLLVSLARNEQRKDSDVDICVEMVPNLFNQAGVKMANDYFEVDADAIFSIIKNNLEPLKKAIGYFKEELFGNNNH